MTEAKNCMENCVIPSLTIKGAAKAIELYKNAFGAKEESRMSTPDGKIMHACITIGNSQLFIADAMPEMGCGTPSQSTFYVYFDDVDAIFKQATKAGLTEKFAPADMFWGDRTGSVTDPFGNIWSLATHVREVSPQELEEGKKKFMQKAA